MLIPENGKWRWEDGPLCDTKDEALKTATVNIGDADGVVFIDEMTEVLEEVDEGE